MLAGSKCLEGPDDPRGVSQQVRDEHDQGTPSDLPASDPQHTAEIGLTSRCRGGQGSIEDLKLAKPRARRDEIPTPCIERAHTRRIPFGEYQVSHRHGQPTGMFPFGRAPGGRVFHGPRGIDQNLRREEVFLVVFTDIEAILSRIGLPIDGADLITGRVGSVLGEVTGEPAVETAVASRGVAGGDDIAELQTQILEFGEGDGSEVLHDPFEES